MKKSHGLALLISVVGLLLSSAAQSKDKHEYKEQYWDGACKVERKFKKNGEYKEKRKCKGAHYAPPEVYVAPPPAPVMVEPSIVIQGQGTVRLP